MALIVQKYGGSSVADTQSLQRVARRIVQTRQAGHQVVVVVSAMGDTTDDLIDMAAELNGYFTFCWRTYLYVFTVYGHLRARSTGDGFYRRTSRYSYRR